ncbi:FMNH2-dependent alkanesulfonate monooxygenase [Kroppenstedtia pulmonis]|uniref:Alkanesulfonate monooxygenase n=1 Tax=Kroppenstedtia pulmonis TaxID=1380685 RepID=A0A7D3XHE1_9BACL|nr:FMNH2-dependent alkanesulfonate monooxygenase [Kroppenstedtia pulmonis]QKG83119.1 FMNH2-dependent alkanesulfonate monooxygenase [Kroppenstedtia pulmonis]
MKLFWFIPTHGDGRYLGTATGGRAVNFSYMKQLAQAVDHLGYQGALLPTGRSCEDAWVVASALSAVTRRMGFLVAVRPGLVSPSVAARMASTFDRLSEGRLMINVVTGGDPVEMAGDGLQLDHDTRYELTDEFLSVWREEMKGNEVNFHGKHLDIQGGKLLFPPVQKPYPPLYFGGSSSAGQQVAAKHADVYLTWGEPPEQVKEKIQEVRKRADDQGRTLRFGIRLHVIVRETEAKAWEVAENLIRYVDEDAVERSRRILSRFDSVGQQRMSRLNGFTKEELEISPNLWAGVGLVRGGAGTALVGNPSNVAQRMREYAALGIDTFILSGYPHLEEAYRVAELLFPELPLQSQLPVSPSIWSPFGEIMAHENFPDEKKEGTTDEQKDSAVGKH